MKAVQVPEGTPKILPAHTSRPVGSIPQAGGGIGPLLTRLRTAPEPVKRRLRPALVWLVRAGVAVPGSRRVVRAVMRRMPETSAWLLRRYEIYRQVAAVQGEARRRRLAIAGADDLSRGEVVCLDWLSAALRSPGRATAP